MRRYRKDIPNVVNRTNIYKYIEDFNGQKRYFYFIGFSAAAIPNLPDPSRATLFIEGIEINNDNYDPDYPYLCWIKKDPKMPKLQFKSASLTTTQKFYDGKIPSDIQILSPLYPFWSDVFRGPRRNFHTLDGILKKKDIDTIYIEHKYVAREEGW